MTTNFRILFVCHEYPPNPHGGLGVFVQALAESLASQGVIVGVVGFDSFVKKDLIENSRGVRLFKNHNPFQKIKARISIRILLKVISLMERMVFQWKISKIANNFRPDLIEAHEWSGPLLFKPPAALIVRLHGSHNVYQTTNNLKADKLVSFLERRVINMADFLCGVSGKIIRDSISIFKLTDPKIQVIPNFVDLEKFCPGSPLVEKDNFKKFLYIGRVHPLKGIKDLLKTFLCLRKIDPEYALTIAGEFSDSYRSSLENELGEEVKVNVSWLGKIPHDDIPSLMIHYYSLLAPTKAEAFGLNVIEGMACGLLVFANRIGALSEIIEDENTGVFVNFSEPEVASKRIHNCVSDIERSGEIKRNAVEYVTRKFSQERIVSLNLQFYYQCLKRNKNICEEI
jgi:glycogen synthase